MTEDKFRERFEGLIRLAKSAASPAEPNLLWRGAAMNAVRSAAADEGAGYFVGLAKIICLSSVMAIVLIQIVIERYPAGLDDNTFWAFFGDAAWLWVFV